MFFFSKIPTARNQEMCQLTMTSFCRAFIQNTSVEGGKINTCINVNFDKYEMVFLTFHKQ